MSPSRAANASEVHGPDPMIDAPALVRAAGVGVLHPSGRIGRVRPLPDSEADRKWSAGQTVAFASVASLSLWGAIGYGVYLAVKLL